MNSVDLNDIIRSIVESTATTIELLVTEHRDEIDSLKREKADNSEELKRLREEIEIVRNANYEIKREYASYERHNDELIGEREEHMRRIQHMKETLSHNTTTIDKLREEISSLKQQLEFAKSAVLTKDMQKLLKSTSDEVD